MPTNQPYQEETLIQRIAAGDVHAFESIFNHYRPYLYTNCLRMTGRKMLAEEIVQDTFLKVWLNRESLTEVTNFAGWLYSIASNLTLNAIKKEKTQERTIQGWLREISRQEWHPDETAGQFDDLLATAVARLPKRQRQTFELIKQQGYKREEAALMMKISPETVKWNLDQAMRSIRAYCIAHAGSSLLYIICCIYLAV